MRDPRRSMATLVCETCNESIVFRAKDIAAFVEMDLFQEAHTGHLVRMTLDFPDDKRDAGAAG